MGACALGVLLSVAWSAGAVTGWGGDIDLIANDQGVISLQTEH